MKALVFTDEQEMIYRDEPEPQVEHGDALVKIESVGICGSDMHAYLGHDERRVPPLILGHEAVGTVIEGPRLGSRVVLNPLITCMRCDYCLSGRQNLCAERDLIGMYRPGAFAEMIAIPERNLIEVPDGMESDKAALTEPGATAIHAVNLAERTLSRPISEANTLVIGAGSVGLLTALALSDKGAKTEISETNPLRRQTVQAHTDCSAFDPLDNPPDSDAYDIVFDAVGNAKTRSTAIACVRPGGVVVHIGLMDNEGRLDTRRMTLQEITFIGCYTYSPVDLKATLHKLHSGDLGTLDWISSRPLDSGGEAFKQILAGACEAPKIVLQT